MRSKDDGTAKTKDVSSYFRVRDRSVDRVNVSGKNVVGEKKSEVYVGYVRNDYFYEITSKLRET